MAEWTFDAVVIDGRREGEARTIKRTRLLHSLLQPASCQPATLCKVGSVSAVVGVSVCLNRPPPSYIRVIYTHTCTSTHCMRRIIIITIIIIVLSPCLPLLSVHLVQHPSQPTTTHTLIHAFKSRILNNNDERRFGLAGIAFRIPDDMTLTKAQKPPVRHY